MVRTFPRDMASLPALVDFVREFLAAETLGEDDAYALDLVLEELFTNLVKYGRGARGDVEVGLRRDPSGLVLTLREFDAEFYDPTAAPDVDVTRPIEERRPGGLGIHFVRTLTSEFRYDWRERIGTITVTMRAQN